jgi:hypothetical protein
MNASGSRRTCCKLRGCSGDHCDDAIFPFSGGLPSVGYPSVKKVRRGMNKSLKLRPRLNRPAMLFARLSECPPRPAATARTRAIRRMTQPMAETAGLRAVNTEMRAAPSSRLTSASRSPFDHYGFQRYGPRSSDPGQFEALKVFRPSFRRQADSSRRPKRKMRAQARPPTGCVPARRYAELRCQ